MKPFLKWAGGKRKLLSSLRGSMPKQFNTYYEPFLGGGALFFSLTPGSAVISDSNQELIETYELVRSFPEEIIKDLAIHESRHSKEYFFEMRARVETTYHKASRFIYLNKTCYNGLYRVNKQGGFNTSFGNYIKPNVCDIRRILECSKQLKDIVIKCMGFENIDPERGDFVYFDPPYHGSYAEYTAARFSNEDHERLRDFCDYLVKKGVSVMISNSNTDFVHNLYEGYHISEVTDIKVLGCKNRIPKKELIICG